MRILVLFDLPITTLENKRSYRIFRKYLLKNGFMMMQESVYCKIALNAIAADAIIKKVKLNLPREGLVQLLYSYGTTVFAYGSFGWRSA